MVNDSKDSIQESSLVIKSSKNNLKVNSGNNSYLNANTLNSINDEDDDEEEDEDDDEFDEG